MILGQMKCNFKELNQKLHICACDTIVMPQLYKSGRCREVICGMRISVNSIDTAMNFIDSHEVVQDEIMVKFREMVGQSLLLRGKILGIWKKMEDLYQGVLLCPILAIKCL